MLFELSNLNSNLALTLGYLNPALNNLAQNFISLLVFCRQLLVEEKEGLLGDIAFLQVL